MYLERRGLPASRLLAAKRSHETIATLTPLVILFEKKRGLDTAAITKRFQHQNNTSLELLICEDTPPQLTRSHVVPETQEIEEIAAALPHIAVPAPTA